jgi:hypothetical protein
LDFMGFILHLNCVGFKFEILIQIRTIA